MPLREQSRIRGSEPASTEEAAKEAPAPAPEPSAPPAGAPACDCDPGRRPDECGGTTGGKGGLFCGCHCHSGSNVESISEHSTSDRVVAQPNAGLPEVQSVTAGETAPITNERREEIMPPQSQLTAREKEAIDREVSDYVFARTPAATEAPSAGSDSAAEWIFHTVANSPSWSGEQIRYFIGAALRAHSEDVARAAVESGRQEERMTNPALQAFGAAVAHACDASAKRDREIACDVFNRLVESGNNGSYAFYQAINAIGGRREDAPSREVGK